MSENHSKNCILCCRDIVKSNERYQVEGRGTFDAIAELNSLPFVCERSSQFICKGCLQKLKRRRSLLDSLKKIEAELQDSQRVAVNQHHKRPSPGNDLTSTPKKLPRESFPDESSTTSHVLPWPFSPIAREKERENSRSKNNDAGPKTTEVSVRVDWPSKTSERKLPEDLESLGKMLLRGTYKQIAVAAWKSSRLKDELKALVVKDVEKEANDLCSKKNPSILRKTGKPEMQTFTMEKVCEEVAARAPLLHSVLQAVSVNSERKTPQPSRERFAAIGMAAAVCLRNRSRCMIAVQLMITTFLYHSNWMVS